MKSYSTFSDVELLTYVKSADYGAFAEIYNRYNKLLMIYAYRKLKSTEESKDLVQELFTDLWNSRQVLDIQTTLSGYLYKIALNKMLNIFRHKKISDEYLSSLQLIMETNHAVTDYLIREKEIQALIEKEISLLPPKMREVFELRRNEFLSNKEIAERLDLSEHTVATQMKKALKKLKLKLGATIYSIILLNL